MSGAAVRVQELRKGFDDGDVLDGIDLEVPNGEITLLMGPNGVGKTILLSCIAGGLHPDEGEISVFGVPPEEADRRLSFMLQNAMLVDELTGRENVAFFGIFTRVRGGYPTVSSSGWRSTPRRWGGRWAITPAV